MTAENVFYIDYVEAVDLHFALMKIWGETRFGVDSRDLIESALARPKHAAIYENADLIRQTASLVFGLIKNHPWEGGNKRTATFLTNLFLKRNGWRLETKTSKIVELVLAIESDKWQVTEIENWLRPRVRRV